MCKYLIVKIFLVLPLKFFDLALNLFVQCSMFNAGSMLRRLNKANFRLFIVLSSARRFLSNYLLTGSGKSLILQMALVQMYMHENASAIHQPPFSALCMTRWSNYLLLDVKLLLRAQRKINNKFCRTLSERTRHFLTFLRSLNLTYNGKVAKYAQKRNRPFPIY